MARRNVRNGEDEKRRGAYLGFGSLEALAEALKPKPIPDEVGRREWEQIAERIRKEEAAPKDSEPQSSEPQSSEPQEPQPSSLPPVEALPALASPTFPALITLGKAKLAAVLFFAFVSGSGAGVGCVAAWQAHETGRHGRATPTMAAARVESSTSAAPSTSTRTAAPSSTSAGATLDEGGSRRLLSRMRDAMNARQFSMVLPLAEQHARQFANAHVREREALHIEALRETGRIKDAEQQARLVIGTHPEHRGAMERAAGRALP